METVLAGEGGREEDEAESEERAPKNPKEQGQGREKFGYCARAHFLQPHPARGDLGLGGQSLIH